MKKSTESILILFLIGICMQINAQTSLYHPNRILISFKSNALELEIDALQNAFTATEVERLPETDIRVWEIPSFPVTFIHQGQVRVLANINNVNQSALQEAEVEGVNFDYLLDTYDGRETEGGGNPGDSYDCDGSYRILEMADHNSTKLGIIDTGFSPNDSDDGTDFYFDIEGYGGYNYVQNNGDIEDDNGHGTHVTSVINHISHSASAIDPLESFTQYYIQKTFDNNGNSYLSDIVRAIDRSIANDINILNFAFSYKSRKPSGRNVTPMQRAIIDAENANMLIIAAAGNDFGLDNDSETIRCFPASFDYPNILSVASVSCAGELSDFSNYGVKSIDVAAPGEFIEGASSTGSVVTISGTSQALQLQLESQICLHLILPYLTMKKLNAQFYQVLNMNHS